MGEWMDVCLLVNRARTANRVILMKFGTAVDYILE